MHIYKQHFLTFKNLSAMQTRRLAVMNKYLLQTQRDGGDSIKHIDLSDSTLLPYVFKLEYVPLAILTALSSV